MFKSLLKHGKALSVAFVLAFVAIGNTAMAAAGDVGDTVVTAITAVNPQITAVIGAMAGALVLILAWQLIRKAFGGK